MDRKELPGFLIFAVALATVLLFLLLSLSLNAASPKDPSTPITDIGTRTIANTPFPTKTLLPTLASTDLPDSPTSTRQTAPSPTATAVTCVKRDDWVSYRVNEGDTLSQLALLSGSTVQELLQANCRSLVSLYTGEFLLLPSLPLSPTSTPEEESAEYTPHAPPSTRPTQSSSDGLCLDPRSVITRPAIGTLLEGEVDFFGTAESPDFSFYKLEIRKEDQSSSEDFITFFTGENEVHDGFLGTLLTEAFPDGEYWIRLVVVDTNYNYLERCSILYTIQNH